MSQLVRLEGKHSTQNAHCAVLQKNVLQKKKRVNSSIVRGALSYGQSSGRGVINKSIMAIQTSSEAS